MAMVASEDGGFALTSNISASFDAVMRCRLEMVTMDILNVVESYLSVE